MHTTKSQASMRALVQALHVLSLAPQPAPSPTHLLSSFTLSRLLMEPDSLASLSDRESGVLQPPVGGVMTWAAESEKNAARLAALLSSTVARWFGHRWREQAARGGEPVRNRCQRQALVLTRRQRSRPSTSLWRRWGRSSHPAEPPAPRLQGVGQEMVGAQIGMLMPEQRARTSRQRARLCTLECLQQRPTCCLFQLAAGGRGGLHGWQAVGAVQLNDGTAGSGASREWELG